MYTEKEHDKSRKLLGNSSKASYLRFKGKMPSYSKRYSPSSKKNQRNHVRNNKIKNFCKEENYLVKHSDYGTIFFIN